MKIILDCREQDLFSLLTMIINKNNSDITLESAQLSVGDIIIQDDDETELLVIERKSVKDLAASITDGRYSEQSFRLNNYNLHNHNIVYLIEGSILNYNSKGRRINKNAIYSSVFTLSYYKGFSVYRTEGLNDTAETIFRITDKLRREKNKLGFYTGNTDKIESQSYVDVMKAEKKANITINNIGEVMLRQIPGVSANYAKVIMERYNTLIDLICDLQENPDTLNGITYKTGSGQARKISGTCISNIKTYLLQDSL